MEDRINALLTRDKNKLKVYEDGFDGHSLRAHTYWSHLMPDIRQADTKVQCYEHEGIAFTSTDIINYKGFKYTGDEFYAEINAV